MKKLAAVSSLIASATLAVSMALPVNFASAAAEKGGYAGKTEDEITKSLQDQGYEVRKIEVEDGYLEAYALLNGERFEIYVNPKTGEIVKIEKD